MKSAGPGTIRLHEVQRFSSALALALIDTEIERQRTIHYYFDADVVVNVVLGFLQFQNTQSELDRREYVVQALLSEGLLCPLRILRPHALELEAILRSQPNYRTDGELDHLKKQFSDFIDQRGVARTLQDLDNILDGSASDKDKQREFLSLVRQHAPRAFYALEFVNGTWTQRLKRLHERGLLLFEASSPDVHLLVGTREVQTIKGELGRARPLATDLANLFDAVGLVSLNWLQRQGQSVRFYTETKALQTLVRHHPAALDLMTERGLDGDRKVPILRDTEYFLMRANFEALSFGTPTDNGLINRDELVYLSAQLVSVLESSPSRAIDMACKTRLGDRHLSEVIRELSTLTFLQNVVTRSGERLIGEGAEEWLRVWRYATGLGRSDLVTAEIGGVRDELRTYVKDVKLWSDCYRGIQRSAATLRERWHREFAPDANCHLGLVRWGLTLDPDSEELLQSLLLQLTSRDSGQFDDGCAQLATMVLYGLDDHHRVVLGCALLWLLQRYDQIEAMISSHLGQSCPVDEETGLRILQAAAVLRRRLDITELELKELLAIVEAIGFELPPEKLGRYHLGLGFLYFYAYLASSRDRRHDDAQAFARASFEMGWKALDSLRPMSLPWCFAANHCSYVGTVTGESPDNTQAALRYLRECRATDHWHYRFVDTLAYREYLVATEIWSRGAHDDAVRRVVCGRLRSAREIFETIGPTYGDSEVEQHRLQLSALELDAGCVGPAGTTSTG